MKDRNKDRTKRKSLESENFTINQYLTSEKVSELSNFPIMEHSLDHSFTEQLSDLQHKMLEKVFTVRVGSVNYFVDQSNEA